MNTEGSPVLDGTDAGYPLAQETLKKNDLCLLDKLHN